MVKLNLFEIFKLTFNVPIFWARVVVIIVAASQTGIHFLFQWLKWGRSGEAKGKPSVSLSTSDGLLQSGSAIGEMSIFFRVELSNDFKLFFLVVQICFQTRRMISVSN